jgi:hypothetical protein
LIRKQSYFWALMCFEICATKCYSLPSETDGVNQGQLRPGCHLSRRRFPCDPRLSLLSTQMRNLCVSSMQACASNRPQRRHCRFQSQNVYRLQLIGYQARSRSSTPQESSVMRLEGRRRGLLALFSNCTRYRYPFIDSSTGQSQALSATIDPSKLEISTCRFSSRSESSIFCAFP